MRRYEFQKDFQCDGFKIRLTGLHLSDNIVDGQDINSNIDCDI